MARDTQAARLLPSGSGWFQVRRQTRTCRLVGQIWVELVAAVAGLRGVQGGVRQLDAGRLGQAVGVDAVTQARRAAGCADRANMIACRRTP